MVQATTQDILSDENLIESQGEHIPPARSQKALEVYMFIRSANPWLPDPMKIPADTPLELTWGPNQITTLSMTVAIELPDGLTIPDEMPVEPS